MEYNEETVKNFFEYYTSRNFVKQYTYYELYNLTKRYFDHVGFLGVSDSHKELWDRMTEDLETVGYLQLEV